MNTNAQALGQKTVKILGKQKAIVAIVVNRNIKK